MLLLGESSVNMIGDRGTLVEGKSAENVTWNEDLVGEVGHWQQVERTELTSSSQR